MTQDSSRTQDAPVRLEIVQEGELSILELDEILDILANHLLSQNVQNEREENSVNQERCVE